MKFDRNSYVLGILTIIGLISFAGIAFADSEIGDRIVALWFHGNISNTTGYLYDNLTSVPTNISLIPIGVGYDNQLVGWNSSINMQEYKNLSGVDNNITVTNTKNNISIGLAPEVMLNNSPHYTLRVFTRDLTVAAGTQSITGVGFKPSGVLFYCAVEGAAGKASWGFSDNSGSGGVLFDDNADTAGAYLTNPYSIELYSASTYQRAAVSSYDPDGFTLTWTKFGSPTGTATCRILVMR